MSELPASDDPIEVRLTLPSLLEHARVARLAIAGLATRNGLSYDEVEDLRIAIGEAFAMLVLPDEPTARVCFTNRFGEDGIEVVAERVPPSPLAEVDELSRTILAAVTDDASIDAARGVVTLRKRTQPHR